MMAGVTKNNPGRMPTSWEVQQSRIASSEAKSGDLHWTRRLGVSDETRKRRSDSSSGKIAWTDGHENTFSRECPGPGWSRGLTLTENQRNSRGDANRGKRYGKRDPQVGQKISAAKKGVPFTPEHRDALSTARVSIPVQTCEHCGKEIKGGNGNLKQHTRSRHPEK
jgi:ribosomal protein L37AE/L43A